jgi:hypothetical protein
MYIQLVLYGTEGVGRGEELSGYISVIAATPAINVDRNGDNICGKRAIWGNCDDVISFSTINMKGAVNGVNFYGVVVIAASQIVRSIFRTICGVS